MALMREPLFDEHESINTWLYGFDNYSRGDTFIYGHSGGTLRFFTEFALVPEYDISVFVSTNTTMGFRVIGAVLRGILDRYLPDPMENVEPLPLTDLDKIAGHWSTYRHPVTTPDKIIRALQPVVVQPVSDNELMVAGLAEHPTYWRQVAPLEFKRVDENVSLVFQPDASPPRMLVGSVLSSYYKISWIESTNAQGAVADSQLVDGVMGITGLAGSMVQAPAFQTACDSWTGTVSRLVDGRHGGCWTLAQPLTIPWFLAWERQPRCCCSSPTWYHCWCWYNWRL